MHKRFPYYLLLINGGLYILLGVLFAVSPMDWFARLAIELNDAAGYTELLSMYIGLMSGIGLFSIICAVKKPYIPAGLLFTLVSYLGLAIVRSWGIFVGGNYDQLMLQLLMAEVVGILSAGFGLYCVTMQERKVIT